MGFAARYAARSDIGRHRQTNEDSWLARPPLFAVADGMGGAQAGEVASRVALETLAACAPSIEPLAREAAGEALLAACYEANRRVWELSHEHASRAGMGTTLTAVALCTDGARLAHIGDSRAYLLRNGELTQVSDDHSLVGEMVRSGELAREDAVGHPLRSILSRALGTEPDPQIDLLDVDLAAGDVLLLCSDGLTGPVSDARIALLLGEPDPEEAARRLVEAALRGGGPDNITVVVIRLDEVTPAAVVGTAIGASAPAPTEAPPSQAASSAAGGAAEPVGGVGGGAEPVKGVGGGRSGEAGAAAGQLEDAGERADATDLTMMLSAADIDAASGAGIAAPAGTDAGAGTAASASTAAPAGAAVSPEAPGERAAGVPGATPDAAAERATGAAGAPIEQPAEPERPYLGGAAGPPLAPAAGKKSAGKKSAAKGGAKKRRRWLPWLVTLLVLAVAVGAAVFVVSQLEWVGTDDAGAVTVNRGLPWEFAGVRLYREHEVTTLQYADLSVEQQQVVDAHGLGWRGSGERLVTELRAEAP